MPRDDENVRHGEPPRRKPRGERKERSVPRADRMERRRNRYHAHDELPMDDLRAIALYQKILILCILALLILYFGVGVVQAMARPGRPSLGIVAMQIALGLATLITVIASTIFVFL